MDSALTRGRDFLQREGRLLERRLFAVCFEGAPPQGVVEALRGYRNPDGGFGHGLEPDKRCPHSLPIDVEVALQALVTAGADDPGIVRGACDYLEAVAESSGAGGAVPPAFPVIEAYPRAEHWSEWTFVPGINPTAGLVGWLRRLGSDHPWVGRAERYCWETLDSGRIPDDVHALWEALVFLEHTRERERAQQLAGRVRERLVRSPMFHLLPGAEGYGLTPLHIAPLESSRWHSLFDESVIASHLGALAAAQDPDGGWPLSWEPPSLASRLEWRGMETLRALRTLSSYGRM